MAAFVTQHDNYTEQIKELQHAIRENTRKLEEVKQKRLRVEEEIMQCTREANRRVGLMMVKSGVVDGLQQLGQLLQEEKHLSEQLNGQASVERNLTNNLQERNERITNKARSLAAVLLEVKQHLAEAKAQNIAAQALTHTPTSKSKRNQSK